MCVIFIYAGTDTAQVICHYYSFLEAHMDAETIIHMMHCNRILTDDDYCVITTAPNDMKRNTLLLQFIQKISKKSLLKFCNILMGIDDNHKRIGESLKSCKTMMHNACIPKQD